MIGHECKCSNAFSGVSLIGRWLVLIRLPGMMNGLRLIWDSVFGFECTVIHNLRQGMLGAEAPSQGAGNELRRIRLRILPVL